MSGLPDWTKIPRDDLRTRLTAYCGEGLSAQQIADKFENCSRSAAIGMISRLKLQLKSGNPRRRGKAKVAGISEATPKVAKPAARKASKLVQQTSSWRGASNPPAGDFKARAEQREKSPGLPAHLVTGEARRPIDAVIPISRRLQLTELTERTCKWPNGDPQAEDFGFCGNEAAQTGPYCRYHARVSYAPPTYRLSVPKGA